MKCILHVSSVTMSDFNGRYSLIYALAVYNNVLIVMNNVTRWRDCIVL